MAQGSDKGLGQFTTDYSSSGNMNWQQATWFFGKNSQLFRQLGTDGMDRSLLAQLAGGLWQAR